MERKKTGRPSKGSRQRVPVRLPDELAEAARERAAERGMTFNDYVCGLIVAELQTPDTDQEALPLAKSA